MMTKSELTKILKHLNKIEERYSKIDEMVNELFKDICKFRKLLNEVVIESNKIPNE